jgi:NAD-dependent SIR2 family protein deacetylase
MDEAGIGRAADLIEAADALLIGAGAGMGVDSGLPDFRGAAGFWRAYPVYEKLGLNFSEMANPRWFEVDPTLAWGFYGHRLGLYRATRPHDGYTFLRAWAKRMPHGAFVFTSNVDHHFQDAGFDPDRILEVHGSIEWLQCMKSCGVGLFPADRANPRPVIVNETTMRAAEPLPACPECGALARPNIFMFNDRDWDEARAMVQRDRMDGWLKRIGEGRLCVIECGAGTAIPTVRRVCESMAKGVGTQLIRINVREPDVPEGHIGMALGGLNALRAIGDELVRRTRR